MDEPQPIASDTTLQKFQQMLQDRGLGHIPTGPIDDAPTPDEPGHPDYHRRQRIDCALTRWRALTPRRYQQATATHPGVIAWAQHAASAPHAAGFLLLTGPFGTGKTHQAYGALRRIAETGPSRYEVIAITAPDMYALLRPGSSDRGPEYELRRLKQIGWLLVDDLGTEKISPATEEATYRLINDRYNECRPMIVTSNLPARDNDGPDLADKLGERIVSRLSEMTTVIAINGADRRRGGA